MNSKCIAVTGITGHTGKFFISELVKNNYKGKIKCLVINKFDERNLKRSGLKYELIVGDVANKNDLLLLTKDVDTIVEIYNIHFSLEILDAAITNKVNRIIAVHTTGIFSRFKMASIEYKRIEEKFIEKAKKNGIQYTILRPTMIFGDMCDKNISHFIKMVDKMRLFPLIANGKAKIQPVNARDLGKAYSQVLNNPSKTRNKTYNLSGQEEICIKDMLKQIAQDLGKKTFFLPVPMWLALIPVWMLKIVSFGKKDYVEKVLRMSESRVFSHADATKDFGYCPFSFREGLKNEIAEFLTKRGK